MAILRDTYHEALNVNSEPIKQYIINNIDHPFFIVGSGGSFCICETIALLIESIGGIAKAITPYEIRYSRDSLKNVNLIFYSASGGNSDIIGAYNYCKKNHAKKALILCLRKYSKLKKIAENDCQDISFFEYPLPFGKDGFLAFHSTLFALGILQSVYCNFFDVKPYKWTDNIFSFNTTYIDNKSTIMVLGSGWSMPVVKDFESKCTEAALSRVLYSDIRNFAHGRHHWLAKHPDTLVIAFSSFSTKDLVNKTLELIPSEINRQVIFDDDYNGIASTIELYLKMCMLVSELGKKTGIDPGKPGVPDFGSKLYHLTYTTNHKPIKQKTIPNDIISRMVIRKKSYTLTNELKSLAINSAKKYTHNLANSVFKGLVIDYDNTVIRFNDTSDSTYKRIISHIEKYIRNGVCVCFATGRGKSIKQQLCEIIDENIWEKVYVSYYNGAFTIPLSDELWDTHNNVPQTLIQVDYSIKAIPLFNSINTTIKNTQITYESNDVIILDKMFDFIIRRIMNGMFNGVKAEKSDHSVDVTLKYVSKRNSVEFVQKKCNGLVLCIGDAGSEQGNDYELLNTDFSLSVSDVSCSLDNCWNIASRDISGPEATLEYFSNIRILKKGLAFNKKYLSFLE